MGFFSDYLEELSRINNSPNRSSFGGDGTFILLEKWMKEARIVRMGSAQADVFLNTPQVEQDYRWLRLPYPSVYIHLDAPLIFKDYIGEIDHFNLSHAAALKSLHGDNPPIRSIQIRELTIAELIAVTPSYNPSDETFNIDSMTTDGVSRDVQVQIKNVERAFIVIVLMPLPDFRFNLHVASMYVSKDGELIHGKLGAATTRDRILAFAIHAMNFLNSPAVKLAPNEVSAALQKARVKRGKPPLPGWYEITYRQHLKNYTKEKFSTEQYHHGFRYDVRGHFMRFTRGPMTGRVIWCPPHQRGLKNTLYKPKTYKLETQLPVPPVWEAR